MADRPLSLLLVDDDPSAIESLGRMIAKLGQVRFALNAQQALQLARQHAPDLILADQEMPGGDGLSLIKALQSDPSLATIPVILVTSHTDVANEVAGFAAGASDFIRKPAAPEVVLARATMQLRIKLMSDRLRTLAGTDALTGLANRHQYNQTLTLECQRARRSGQPLALLMIDIDHFKGYNDHFGHLQGDRCLVEVARAITAALQRSTDFAARWGGEEFSVLLPMTNPDGALEVAHRVQQQVAALHLHHPLGIKGQLTVSVGVAVSHPNTEDAAALDPTALLAAADRRLYQAKRNGRNRVVSRGCETPSHRSDSDISECASCVAGPLHQGAACFAPLPAPIAPAAPQQPSQPQPEQERDQEQNTRHWPPIEGIDLAEAQIRLGGSLDLFSRMVHRLCDDATALMSPGLPPSQELAPLLHRIGGTAGFVGANDLNQASLAAERALREGKADASERVQHALQLLRNLRASALRILTPSSPAPEHPVREPVQPKTGNPAAAAAAGLMQLQHLLLEHNLQARSLADHLRPDLLLHLGEDGYSAFLKALNRLDYPAAAGLLPQ